MTASTPLSRFKQLWIVISALGASIVTSGSAVAYVAVRDHTLTEYGQRLDKIEQVVPVVQTSLAVVQAQLEDVQTTLDRIDERGARRDHEPSRRP